MKKLFVFFSFVCLLFTGCKEKEHLTFKNIPITGKIEKFQKQLEIINFKKDGDYYCGNLTPDIGSQVKLSIECTPITHTVFAVNVYFADTFSTPAWNFYYYTKLYTQKYGKPLCIKNPVFMDGWFEIDAEKSKVNHIGVVSENWAKYDGEYVAIFYQPNGKIILYARTDNDYKSNNEFSIHYVDTKNTKLYTPESEQEYRNAIQSIQNSI